MGEITQHQITIKLNIPETFATIFLAQLLVEMAHFIYNTDVMKVFEWTMTKTSTHRQTIG